MPLQNEWDQQSSVFFGRHVLKFDQVAKQYSNWLDLVSFLWHDLTVWLNRQCG